MESAISSKRKDDRIEVRVRRELKEVVVRAAQLVHQTISDFVLSAVVERAQAVIREAELIKLSRRDSERFLAALDADLKPNDALMKAAHEYREAVSKGSLQTV